MTDTVNMGIEALRPFALDIRPEVPGDTMIDTLAWTADQHRAAFFRALHPDIVLRET